MQKFNAMQTDQANQIANQIAKELQSDLADPMGLAHAYTRISDHLKESLPNEDPDVIHWWASRIALLEQWGDTTLEFKNPSDPGTTLDYEELVITHRPDYGS